MIIQFDKNTMHVQLIVGTKETYTPTAEIEEIQKQVDELRAELSKFQKDVVIPKLQKIEEKVKEENDKFQAQIKKSEE